MSENVELQKDELTGDTIASTTSSTDPVPSTARPTPNPIPSTPEESTQCVHCHNAATVDQPLKLCTKCQSVRYCSRNCQKAAWKAHKKQCPLLAQAYAAVHEPVMAVARAPPPPPATKNVGG